MPDLVCVLRFKSRVFRVRTAVLRVCIAFFSRLVCKKGTPYRVQCVSGLSASRMEDPGVNEKKSGLTVVHGATTP